MDLRRLKDAASEHFRRGRFAKAAEAYAELCRQEPKEAQHRIKLGDSYRRDGRRDKAIEAYRQASMAYAEQGVIIKAIAACKLVLELDPEHLEAQEELANLCTRRYVRSSPAPGAFQQPARPLSQPAPVPSQSNHYDAIELPEDDGEEVEIVTASGAPLETDLASTQTAQAPRRVRRPLPEIPVEIQAPSIPRVSPHGGGDEIELDLADGSSAADSLLSPAEPSWPQQPPTVLDTGVIELEELQETASPVSSDVLSEEPALDEPAIIPAPPERRRGPAIDLSAWSEPSFPPASDIDPDSPSGEPAGLEPEYLDPEELEPLDIVDPEEIGAELIPAAPPRESPGSDSDDLALAAAAQSVADMLSDSLLVDGASDDGYEVELLSVTASAPEWAEDTPPPEAASSSATGIDPAPAPDSPEFASASSTAPAPTTGSAASQATHQRSSSADAGTSSPSSSKRRGPVVIRPATSSRPEDSAQALVPDFSGTALDLLHSDQLANEAFEAADQFDDRDTPAPAADVDQSSVPLFSELPREAFLELLQRLTFRRHEPGDVVIREGDSGRSIFVLASGRLRVVKGLGGSDEVELAILEEGSFFGEMALLNGTPRVASVVAVDEVETLEITEALLQELVSRYSAVGRSLKKFYRQRLLSNVMAISPIFRSLGRRDRRALLERFKLREISAGHVVCREGEENDGLYVVMHGRLQVTRAQEDGKSITLAVLREGDIFGESSLLARSVANATVTSTRKTLLLRLPRDSFNELISTHPMVLEVLSMLADGRERETREILSGERPPPDETAA